MERSWSVISFAIFNFTKQNRKRKIFICFTFYLIFCSSAQILIDSVLYVHFFKKLYKFWQVTDMDRHFFLRGRLFIFFIYFYILLLFFSFCYSVFIFINFWFASRNWQERDRNWQKKQNFLHAQNFKEWTLFSHKDNINNCSNKTIQKMRRI